MTDRSPCFDARKRIRRGTRTARPSENPPRSISQRLKNMLATDSRHLHVTFVLE